MATSHTGTAMPETLAPPESSDPATLPPTVRSSPETGGRDGSAGMERLDFTLPDFTRLAWVTDQAERVWRPRLEDIATAWAETEWRAVLTGVRSCAVTMASPEEFLTMGAAWAEDGRAGRAPPAVPPRLSRHRRARCASRRGRPSVRVRPGDGVADRDPLVVGGMVRPPRDRSGQDARAQGVDSYRRHGTALRGASAGQHPPRRRCARPGVPLRGAGEASSQRE